MLKRTTMKRHDCIKSPAMKGMIWQPSVSLEWHRRVREVHVYHTLFADACISHTEAKTFARNASNLFITFGRNHSCNIVF